MIGIVLITHGPLGAALAGGAAHVLGKPLDGVATLAVEANDSMESIAARARGMVHDADDGSGVLVISDICGGTPCNVATRLALPGRVEVICGASLPMLVRALTYRDEPLENVVKKALSGGNEGVMNLSGRG